jgi:hypothetical protein
MYKIHFIYNIIYITYLTLPYKSDEEGAGGEDCMDSESLHVHIKTEPKKETTISIPLAITKSRIMIEITQVTEIIDRQLLYIQTRLKKNVFQFSFSLPHLGIPRSTTQTPIKIINT